MKNTILYYSTNHKSPPLPFDEALLRGQAPDKGLYMPERIPQIPESVIVEMKNMKYHEIASIVTGNLIKGAIEKKELEAMAQEAYNYEVPLEHVTSKKYIMRLDQGPTASFKDFAGRMMGKWMNHYLNKINRKLLILTATSGDTGSAIANAFYGFDNIEVVILFPVDEVTARQRKQMTTLGKNIRIIGLNSKFDDCQALVKNAFADSDLNYLNLSSANSINIGRLIPQTVYYFYAYAKLSDKPGKEKIIFSIPSGNFGNMMGGMLAMKMGLPVEKFIISTNENDEFPAFLNTGNYKKISPSKNCISSAMNVGHPSNLARLVDLYNGNMDETGKIHKLPDMEEMRKNIFSVSVSDNKTESTIKDAWKKYKLLLEPHGAVSWNGIEQFLKENPEYNNDNNLFVSLETAHPAKFPEKIRELLGFDPKLPPSLEGIEEKEEKFDKIDNNYAVFKQFLIENYK